MSADGNTAIVGGPGDNSATATGAVWVYTRSNGVWTQQGSKLVGTGAVGSPVQQGESVALSADGNTAAAPYLHPRLEVVPITMFESLGTDGNKFTIDSTKLTDQELEVLEQLLIKAQHKPNGNGAAPVNGNQVH